MPEPQTLLTVVAGTLSGIPAPRCAWRAGAWPMPAESTLPMKTSPTSSGATFARSSAALMAVVPSCGAVRAESEPRIGADGGTCGRDDEDGG